MKILLTGAKGFIGSHIVTGLTENGFNVMPFVGDVTKLEDWEKALKSEPEIIIHAAGVRTESESDFEVNAASVDKLAKALQNSSGGVKAFILISSQAVYFGQKSPLKEDMVLNPQNIYAKSKLQAEVKAMELGKKFDLRVVILRPSTVLGAGVRLGNRMSGPLAMWTRSALNSEPLIVNQDGEQTRDYVHVEDLVSAAVLAIKNESINGIYNVGGGKKIKLLELANIITQECKSDSRIIVRGGQATENDPRELFSDNEKLRSFGWDVKHTPQEAVKEYVNSLKPSQT